MSLRENVGRNVGFVLDFKRYNESYESYVTLNYPFKPIGLCIEIEISHDILLPYTLIGTFVMSY